MTFDCGKEFSQWEAISKQNDVNIYFAHPNCPFKRGLNENSNGLLRRDSFLKEMDFTDIPQAELNQVTHYRHKIPRKTLKTRHL